MWYRWIGVGVVFLLATGLWQVRGGAQPPERGAGGDDASLVKRGQYLVHNVAHCTHCHTPQDDQGKPDQSRMLQGATLPIEPKKKTKNWAAKSPDITRSGMAGEWEEEELVKFLMTGESPEGHSPRAPMPIFKLHKEDARAVAAYLRSLPGKKGKQKEGGGKRDD
jgi:mono/diheme cytochrome c family protein